MMKKILLAVFFLPLLCFGVLLSGLSLYMAFTSLPAGLVWFALGIMALIVVWFFVRRASGSGVVSESSLLAQTSKDGLL